MSLIGAIRADSVQIERRTRVQDSTGSWVPGPKVLIDVPGASVISLYGVAVGSSSEADGSEHTVITRRVLNAPVGTDVRPDDVIVHRGRRYAVKGEELEFLHTSLAHIEVQVEEVTG
ncbi:hypothetical protein [Streptomyces hydrogenans]|uniref:hypothetical protein n=1 Tax=Streptomyces hydrogenans TaxID=1873719 RepID=UPI0035DE02FA